MEERVKRALAERLHGIKAELEQLPGGRISGHVIWDGFADQEHVDRQRVIRDALRASLGPEAQQVGVLLAYTPRELELMAAA